MGDFLLIEKAAKFGDTILTNFDVTRVYYKFGIASHYSRTKELNLHNLRSWAAVIIASFMFLGCGKKEAPIDANGKTPQQVLLETYSLITQGEYETGMKNFSVQYIEELITSKDQTFVQFHSNPQGIDTRNWKVEWLKSNLVGNDYNDNVWRANLDVDAGKGKDNPPGVVHDFHLIDGVWKIVLWSNYPKS